LQNSLNNLDGLSYQSITLSGRPDISSAMASPLPGVEVRRPKTVRSQYPPYSTEKHVEYILVASFDIDRGSIMEHQYPSPVGGDEHMLAELMLPDQAHVRSQDWTIFFLHKDAGQEEDHTMRQRRRRRWRAAANAGIAYEAGDDGFDDDGWDDGDPYDDSSEDELDINPDGPPLVYVLNLVNTKQDNTVKRGAVVKAMAICTRHSFLHIYKPLLLLALEQYFASPTVETLASLYNAVNSMDLSLMPKLNYLEKFILQASDAKDLFLEKFEALIAQRVQTDKDSAALAIEPPTHLSKTHFGLPRDTHEFESTVNYANVPVPVKIPTAVVAETVGDFSLIKLITTFSSPQGTAPVPFNPTHPHLTTSGPNTNPIIVLLNALLTQKRVIFLGHNLPSSEVAEAVLAACALASGGLLRGFTRHAFPYTDLTKIDDLLKVPGFIAGVTNPAFAHKAEWWDVLCDLGTGKMRISNRIEQAALTDGVIYFATNNGGGSQPAGVSALITAGATLSAGLGGSTAPTGNASGDATGDGVFMQSVHAAINERHGENAIRTKFRKWVVRFTRLAASFEETVYGASNLHTHTPDSPTMTYTDSPAFSSPHERKMDELPADVTGHGYVWPTPQSKNLELAANSTRIEGWRNTRSYYNFIQDLTAVYIHRPIKRVDIQHLYDKLAKLRLTNEQSANIYLALCGAVHTEQEISQLLTTMANGIWENKPSASATAGQPGLLYIGMGLFHPRQDVREEVAALLGRVENHEAGRHYWQSLGRFAKIACERIVIARGERLRGEEH
jgi:hypothetical protein